MASPLPAAGGGVESIRTLALLGPAAAGKTSLAEALLAASGAIVTPGSLERGTTASDFDPLERRMQHSLNASVLHLVHAATRIHFIDTPGAADFLGQSLPALEAVETAAVVVNAVNGVEPVTVRMMDHAAARQRDRLIVVNKIDSPGVDLAAVLAQIQATFGKECLPVNLPDAGGTRVVDCFHNRQGHSDFGSVENAHRALVEQVVEVDAGFVERYLEDGDVEASELHAPLEQALREGHLIPVCFVSAKSGVGVAELLDIIVKLLPHPGEANPPDFLRGEGPAAVPLVAVPDPARHVLAHVFKVTVDPFVGRLGVCRIHQGTVTRDSLLYIGEDRKPFKVGHLFMLRGKDHVEVAQALPGDIVAVAKVDEIRFDAVLHDAAGDDHIHLAPLPFPKPVHGLAIEPKRHGDEQRMWEILTKLVDEDPCLKLEHVTGTNETIVYGLGELHLRVLLERLRETYRFEVEHAAAADRLPRDDHRACRGPSPPQEAKRRRRPVRRSVPARRAAAARRWLRVRRSGARRNDPGPVHSGGGEGRARGARERRDHRSPDRRRPGRRLRRQAPQRRQQGDRLRHRRPQGASSPRCARPGRSSSSRSCTSRSPLPSRRWATSPATWRRGAAW